MSQIFIGLLPAMPWHARFQKLLNGAYGGNCQLLGTHPDERIYIVRAQSRGAEVVRQLHPFGQDSTAMLETTLPIVTDLVRDAARPITGANTDYDSLLDFIGNARFVLLGEASHGTHEFYRERARIASRTTA